MAPRYFRHGELPLVVLAILAGQPMHPYELMAELSRLCPDYRPSPGSVYPAVDALAAEGLLVGEPHDGKTVYRTTAEGERALQARADMLAAFEVRTGVRLARGDSLEAMLARFRARLMPLAGRVDGDAVAQVLDRAAGEVEQLGRVGRVRMIKGVVR
jgi:DNA-binding PadR family transcriptional regulator